jgi:hypothetical protein
VNKQVADELLSLYERKLAAQSREIVTLRMANKALVAELTEAVEIIRFLHGVPGWTEYQHSPEMKRIAAALAAAKEVQP